ncbi:hypothetical protein GJ496_002054 [Pomphorhynchus laevis]|nr:hypothetical protein GJ496_002054 [Pomphorhynchus laevis]
MIGKLQRIHGKPAGNEDNLQLLTNKDNMETLIEFQRKCHEERERIIEAMTKENLKIKQTCKEQVISDHIVALLHERYIDTTERLANCYEDKDGMRYEEVKSLGGDQQFSEFYVKIKHLREKSNRPAVIESKQIQVAVPLHVEIERTIQALSELDSGLVAFTDEECWGRCLDLTNLHQQYIQLAKQDPPMDYITYINKYNYLFELFTQKHKLSMYSAYKNYLNNMIEYLSDFVFRAQPLQQIMFGEEKKRDLEKNFEDQWTAGTFPGWTNMVQRKEKVMLDLQSFSRVEELASLGLDGLKQALLALSLKCGGTLNERANRLWNALKQSRQSNGNNNNEIDSNNSDKAKQLAKLEAEIYQLSEEVDSLRANTIENVQRKQARAGAMDDEIDDGDEFGYNGAIGNDEDEDNEYNEYGEYEGSGIGRCSIYNPKNLPLGWDGKPIPYWLYKLHGLNIYYNCEICGNFKYRGPKAFQRHFAEWRHAHGMRCLGIPNTAHFANITLIEDAVALWDRLRRKKESEHWKPDIDEEFEDNSGNVVTRKVYEDLRRQGLL